MSLFFSYSREKSIKTGEKYVQQGKMDAAIKEYERVLEAEPNDLTILVTVGGLYAQVGRTKEAVVKFLKVAEHHRKNGHITQAMAMYRKINRLDPNDYGIALILADLSHKQGNESEALQYYVAAAQACKNNGQYVNAVKVLKEAVKFNPDNLHLRVELADALHNVDFVDEAHETLLNAGREFYRRGLAAEGLHAFQKALVVKPGSKPALKALIDFSLQKGDAKGAVTMLSELLENSPKDVDLIVLLGRTCLSAKMYDEAEDAFSRLIDLDPSRYEYLLEVARGFLGMGQFTRVIAIIDRCTDLIIARRHKKKATAFLKDIIQRDPKNLMAMQKLAEIYQLVGERRNLTTTLNTLVEAALEQGAYHKAKMALEQLIAMTPKKKAYKIQLARLDPSSSDYVPPPTVEVDASELVEAGGVTEVSGDYSTELLEHMLAQSPELVQARLKLLEDMIAQQPEYIEARQQLKQRYIEAGFPLKAALECLEIARLYEVRENHQAADELSQEAFRLDPSLKTPSLGPPPFSEFAFADHHPGDNTAYSFLSEPASKTDANPTPISQFSPPIDSFSIPRQVTGELPQLPAWEVEDSQDEEADIETATLQLLEELSGLLAELKGPGEFHNFVDAEWQRTYGAQPMSVIKVLVDHFGPEDISDQSVRINYLNPIAEMLQSELRIPGQLLAYGGNSSFFVFLPQSSDQYGNQMAEHLRAMVESLWFPHPTSESGDWVTISVGVVTSIAFQPSIDPLFSALEAALELASDQGGNRVMVSPPFS